MTMAEYDAMVIVFEDIADRGPVTTDEIMAALVMAAEMFEAESFDSEPFRRLIARMRWESISAAASRSSRPRPSSNDSLDAAWAAAEAALPAHWEHLTVRLHRDRRERVAYEAAAGPYHDEEHQYAFGRTPTDALRELAHRLAVKP